MNKYFKKEEMQKFLADVISFKIWDYDEEINRANVIKKLYEIPTINIVHCKGCRHWKEYQEFKGEHFCDNERGMYGDTRAEDYCSHGEE